MKENTKHIIIPEYTEEEVNNAFREVINEEIIAILRKTKSPEDSIIQSTIENTRSTFYNVIKFDEFDEAIEISVEHKFKQTMASMIKNFVSFRNR
mgnify:CR=1 FL=1